MNENIEEKNKIDDNKKKGKLSSEDLKEKLGEYKKKSEEYLAGWQRARADFLNYKKEEMERIGEILKYANENFVLKILPILDNFEKATKAIPEDKKNDKFLEGLLQIKNQLEDFLKNQGGEEIKAVGEKFDPNLHEVIEEVEVKDKESGTIITEIQKGYKLHYKVIRPSKVKVAK